MKRVTDILFKARAARTLTGATTTAQAAVLLLAVMLTATTARADDVNYIDADGSSMSHDATALAGSETGWTGWYVASGAVEISDRVVVTGEVYLILADGATLTIPKGITVTEDNSLTIYGQALGTGSLTIASPESGYAGIGGYVIDSGSYTAANTGSITINGGIIDVIGSNVTAGGAAIGGVYWGNTGSITINGGSVTATGKRLGAGIGSGADASGGGTITITGGTVVATSAGGAGIGGANLAVTPDIYISGGNVTASSTSVHAGIGGGCGRSANIITISGGTVTAKGFDGGAGIGGGMGNTATPPGTCGTVTITGGTVTAIGGEGAAGIGGGRPFGPAYTGNNGGTIIITGGNVTARTTYHATCGGGYGIGHGYAGNSTGLTADIRLSYTAASNSINAEGYTGAVTITDSKTMSDGTDTYTGVLTSDEITAIAGKTLVPALLLADNDDNNINNYDGQTFPTVTLQGRTLYRDGDWNTLCLPFGIDDFSGTPLEGFTVKELDTETAYDGHVTGIDGTTLYLNFKDATSIEAGKPYIVKKLQLKDDALTPSYTATGGTAGWTTMQACGYDRLIDGDAGAGKNWWTNFTGGSVYCEFHAYQPVYMTGYTLTTGNQKTAQTPTAWTLQGKQNEGDAWTTIDSRNATTTSGDALPSEPTVEKNYTVKNPGTYQYFRFEVTQNGGANYMCLSELTLQAYYPSNIDNIVNPVFSGVTIDASAPTVVSSEDGKVTFVGNYSPIDIAGEDRSILFLGAANTLYYPNDAMTINSCRAHFELNGITAGDASAGVRAFVLNFDGDGEATGITDPTPDPSPAWEGNGCAWYSLDGRRLSGKPTTSGIYINNGRKIVIK